MKKLLLVLLVVGVVLTGGCAKIATPQQETPTPMPSCIPIIENIDPQEAFTLIQNNENNPNFVIIDVRTSEEFADGYIAGAINIDYYSETFTDKLDKLAKDKTYLIYCRSGNRSGKALNIMEELSFLEVYNMSGGIIEWKAEGLPLTK